MKFVSRMKVVFFESVKEKEKELSHTLIIEQMCRNERGFSCCFPPISWWGRLLLHECCKKGACNFSTSHFVNHLRWFGNMQRRLTGIRHMKSNYLHAIFLSWDEEKFTNCKPAQKKNVLKLLQNLKLARHNCEQSEPRFHILFYTNVYQSLIQNCERSELHFEWTKVPKMVHFGEFLKNWSLRSNSVTWQVSFNRTKIGGKCQNSNATFLVIFK